MNKFDEICKMLEKEKNCGCCEERVFDNKYTCAKKIVDNYVNGDCDKLYQLKAESMKSDLMADMAYIVSIVALFSSVLGNMFAIMTVVLGTTSIVLSLYGLAMILAITIVAVKALRYGSQYKYIKK